MKHYRLLAPFMIVLLCLTSGLVLAQEIDLSQPQPSTPTFPPPTQALMPCSEDTAGEAVCDMIATQPEDIAGVWSLYFTGMPAFIRFNTDGTYGIAFTVEDTAAPAEGLPSGVFSFDDEGLFTARDNGVPLTFLPEECQTGQYIVRVISVGEQPVALNTAAVDDCFVNRRADWGYTMLWAGSD